jgi:hypothetical protein
MTPQGKEFASLLFTPRTADKPNQPDYRSSRPARSPTSGRASAGGYGVRLSAFRDSAGPGYGGYSTPGNMGGSPGYGPQLATPATGGYGAGPGRRRSLTPSGSMKEPPSGSMFESPTGEWFRTIHFAPVPLPCRCCHLAGTYGVRQSCDISLGTTRRTMQLFPQSIVSTQVLLKCVVHFAKIPLSFRASSAVLWNLL